MYSTASDRAIAIEWDRRLRIEEEIREVGALRAALASAMTAVRRAETEWAPSGYDLSDLRNVLADWLAPTAAEVRAKIEARV